MRANEFQECLQAELQEEMAEGMPADELIQVMFCAIGELLVEQFGHGGAKEAFRTRCQQTEESLWIAGTGAEWYN